MLAAAPGKFIAVETGELGAIAQVKGIATLANIKLALESEETTSKLFILRSCSYSSHVPSSSSRLPFCVMCPRLRPLALIMLLLRSL